MAKQRRNRVKAFGIEPIPIRSLNSKPGDFTVEERLDGPTGSAGIRPGRKRPPTPASLELSVPQQIQAIAAWSGLWELAKKMESQETPTARSGRPRECTAADVLLFNITNTILGSARATHRLFRDRVQWNLICEAAVLAYPDDRTRRLSVSGITRNQYASYRKSHVEFDDAIEGLAKVFETLCTEIEPA